MEKRFYSKEWSTTLYFQGNVSSQTIYDAQGVQHGCTIKSYLNGLLQTEIDPAGNKTHYSYDANHNLVQAIDSNMTSDYKYDFNYKSAYLYLEIQTVTTICLKPM